jgi:predicted AlkP superfamily pyrophosphatase or phosphodiesterase
MKYRPRFQIYLSIIALFLSSLPLLSQQQKPKLVIGITIDQMRWDFLQRYQNRYMADGFNRVLNQGFSCDNTLIPYAPTVTAAGHACIFTGSIPAINGIVGNNWHDAKNDREVYCSEDSPVLPIGNNHKVNGRMSPKNMWVTTIGDELKLATNFKSKVVGIALKDRGAIFPAGHSADAAYWYDPSSGSWITSSYYMDELPLWIKQYNEAKGTDKYYAKGWSTLYPVATYGQSTSDEKIYEGKYRDIPSSSFPYNFSMYIGKNYGIVSNTPQGNTMTLDIAKLALKNHTLGKDNITDLLTISLSSPDYIGHQFGPNSIETEDAYLRLDKDLADFFKYLDNVLGKNTYTVFITADHGVAHIPGFLREHKLPNGDWRSSKTVISANDTLLQKFGVKDLIITSDNNQLYLNQKAISDAKLSYEEVSNFIIDYYKNQEGVFNAFSLKDINNVVMPVEVKNYFINGYESSRSGDIQYILKPGWIDSRLTGTTHGAWYPYDTHIPLLWYGAGIKKGASAKSYKMTDIAPTVCSLLKIQMPSGSIGHVIDEALK